MKSVVKKSALFALAVLLLPACRRDARNENPDTPPPPEFASVTPAAPSMTSTADHAEVFRRAFWRQPTAADRILHAERRIHPAPTDDAAAGESWQWFIQLHPSPELLAALRDPDNLNLLALPSGITPRAWPTTPDSPPAWFPRHDSLAPAELEILQSPFSGLTVLYYANGDVLFATDHGAGFAPPVR